VLSGGSTPRRAYELAAGLEPDWSRVEVWWGDERCVPPEDERSNYRLAREALLDRLQAAPAAVHRIRGELVPEQAAAAYNAELAGVALDLALNGIGPDGHTASLFPGTPVLRERQRLAVAVPAGLEPLVPRVTLTPRAFAQLRLVYLAVGREKSLAVRRAFADPPTAEIPASLVRGIQTTAILDEAAARGLRRTRL
jgi:6-phosphogluconolactonase